jgi:hypothetical protein
MVEFICHEFAIMDPGQKVLSADVLLSDNTIEGASPSFWYHLDEIQYGSMVVLFSCHPLLIVTATKIWLD